MNFLYGVKNCHACALRKGCDEKNSEANLGSLRLLDKFLHRGRTPIVKVQTYCKDFIMEV